MGTAEVYEIQRYERKFVVPESAAEAIRSFVTSYLPIDEHVTPDQPRGYRVISLYLDTPDLLLYRQSCNGIKNRYKLRMRFYNTADDSPVYLEIKRRTTEAVHKMRAQVTRRAAEALLRGRWLGPADLLTNGTTAVRALAEFCRCRDQLHAEGIAYVSYSREAFVSRSAESVRVTFDRKLSGHRYDPRAGLTVPEEPAWVPVKGVVLELKYNGRAPRWIHDLITTFRIERRSFPKYVYAVDALGLTPGKRRMALAAGGVRC